MSIAFDLNKRKNGSAVILVTKDVNLRMKAKALGIPSEDYTTDRITNIEDLYGGKEIVEDFNDDTLIKFFQPPFDVDAKEIIKKLKGEVLPNKHYIFRNKMRSVLACLDQEKQKFRKVDKNVNYGIKPRNAEQTFAVDALTNINISLDSMTGKAGTGKTLWALASALVFFLGGVNISNFESRPGFLLAQVNNIVKGSFDVIIALISAQISVSDHEVILVPISIYVSCPMDFLGAFLK